MENSEDVVERKQERRCVMAQAMEYKCPCCGGAIAFDSSRQKMKCPYCDSEFEIDSLKDYEQELKQEKPDEMNWETSAGGEWEQGETDGMRVYTCQSCGGEIVGDETMAASTCPYCGNNIVLKGQFSGDLRPDYVIPFKLDKKAAKEGLKKHFKGKWLLPRVFSEENHLEEIKGVYVPFWLFDADTDAHIRYRATRIRAWSSSDYDYTETSHYSVIREGSVEFDRVPVDGSSKMADDLMESIEPYDFSEAVDFQTAYLAGYLADKYDVTAEESVARANERIRRSTEEVFEDTVQGLYATVVPEKVSIHLKNGKAKYALYPVWLLTTRWRGKQYLFAMNGQTGKFVGDLPVDNGKYFRCLAALTAGFGAAAYILIRLFIL